MTINEQMVNAWKYKETVCVCVLAALLMTFNNFPPLNCDFSRVAMVHLISGRNTINEKAFFVLLRWQ